MNTDLHRFLKAVVFIGVYLCASVVSPAVTTVSDTLFTADGRTVNGRAVIKWDAFTAADGDTIAAGSLAAAITDGRIAVSLEENAGAVPSGTSYRVEFHLDDGSRWVETWVVPASSDPVTVTQVRVTVPPSPTLLVALSQLKQGGATAGQALKWDGTQWTPQTDSTGSGGIDCTSPGLLTLDGAGAITVPFSGCFRLDTDGGSASDDLELINCTPGDQFLFTAETAARVVRVTTNAVETDVGFFLDSTRDLMHLLCWTDGSVKEINRSSSGG